MRRHGVDLNLQPLLREQFNLAAAVEKAEVGGVGGAVALGRQSCLVGVGESMSEGENANALCCVGPRTSKMMKEDRHFKKGGMMDVKMILLVPFVIVVWVVDVLD